MAVFGNGLLICSFYLLCFVASIRAAKEKKSFSKERQEHSLARDPRQTVIPNPGSYSCPVTETFYELETEATYACQNCPSESCCRCERSGSRVKRVQNGKVPPTRRRRRCINKRRICNAFMMCDNRRGIRWSCFTLSVILAIFLDNNRARCQYETSYDCCEAKLLLQKLIYQINSFCYVITNGANGGK